VVGVYCKSNDYKQAESPQSMLKKGGLRVYSPNNSEQAMVEGDNSTMMQVVSHQEICVTGETGEYRARRLAVVL
jgi:hypothetical protein